MRPAPTNQLPAIWWAILYFVTIRGIANADEKTLPRMESMIDDLAQRQNHINKQAPTEATQ